MLLLLLTAGELPSILWTEESTATLTWNMVESWE